ncbi:MAG: hypothetical protein QM736_27315 [Vicinamibacterales bacterium]
MTIRSLATYVPPRLLTNSDLEKMVDTTDEWILQRTGIRERHIVDPGVATSDLAKEAALEAIRRAGLTPDDIGCHRCRHGHARHDVPEHRVPGAAQDRRASCLGLRRQRRVLGIHLRVDRRKPARGRRMSRARAGHRAPT